MKSNKILVVDDSIENLKVIISIIKKYFPECMIYQANSGKSALSVLKNIKPDIILTDWDMPEMNGIELARTVRNNLVTESIPVIITTGIMISPENLKEALDAGAVDYLRKPINPTELFARITSAIELAEKKLELIREKERKIVEGAILTNHINQFVTKLKSLIEENKTDTPEIQDLKRKIAEQTAKINSTVKEDGWKSFSKSFNTLYPGFEKSLIQKHPKLTSSEIKLSILSRMGLNLKQLAGILYVSYDTIRVSRSRLRKKLNLDPDQNLQSYLSSF